MEQILYTCALQLSGRGIQELRSVLDFSRRFHIVKPQNVFQKVVLGSVTVLSFCALVRIPSPPQPFETGRPVGSELVHVHRAFSNGQL